MVRLSRLLRNSLVIILLFSIFPFLNINSIIKPAYATIAHDNSPAPTCEDSDSTSFSHAITGLDTLLLVTVGFDASDKNPTNVNFGGSTLQPINSQNISNVFIALFKLPGNLSPSTANGTRTLTVTFQSGGKHCGTDREARQLLLERPQTLRFTDHPP